MAQQRTPWVWQAARDLFSVPALAQHLDKHMRPLAHYLGTLPGYKTGSATWDPPSVADGAMTSTTVTVAGARVADASPCTVAFSNAVPAGAQMTADVTANDTVTVKLRNQTGGVLDLASGTVRVHVWVS